MRYGMLGDDNASMEEKLAKYSGKVGWDYLKEHFQNGVLFFVDEELTLEEVGAAISEDFREARCARYRVGAYS